MMASTNNIRGILISCRDVQYVGKRIEEISAREKSHHAANMQEEIKLTKAYCRKIIDMLDETPNQFKYSLYNKNGGLLKTKTIYLDYEKDGIIYDAYLKEEKNG